MQRRNYRCRDLHHEPSNDRVSDGDFVDITPFQLSEEVLRVHCARLDEPLVTEALYLDARDLKSARNVQNELFKTPQRDQSLQPTAGPPTRRRRQFSFLCSRENAACAENARSYVHVNIPRYYV
jgi:hypothetical protein